MKKINFAFVFLFCFLVASSLSFIKSAAAATTYYVSPSGSNSNVGDITRPWQTLAYACTQVRTAGSIIHLKAGTYNESAKCNLEVGVSIEGDGIDQTIIKSNYQAVSSEDGAIRLHSWPRANGNQSVSNLTLDGNNLTAPRGIAVAYRNNVTIHDVKIINFLADALFFTGSTEEWNIEPLVYSTNNSVYNCQISNCADRNASESAQIRINGQSGFSLHHNTFNQTSRPRGHNGNILGGEWNTNLKIYNNTFTKGNDEGEQWNFFFELWHWQGGGEIYNNTFNGGATMDIVDVVKPTGFDYGLKIYNNDYLIGSVVPLKEKTFVPPGKDN